LQKSKVILFIESIFPGMKRGAKNYEGKTKNISITTERKKRKEGIKEEKRREKRGKNEGKRGNPVKE